LPQACEKVYETDVYNKTLAERFKNKFNIVYAGNISPAQSFETIIGAATLLKNDGLKNINWIIIGDGMSRKWLEDEISKAGLSDSFYFEGVKPMDVVPQYTTMADLLIGCLVKSELLEATIPAKVMSYLAAGKPVVLAMDGEVRDLINHKIGCGFAGPAGDTTVLYENIKKVYELSAQDRQKMGNRGRAYHFKHFERNIITNQIYDFIFN
jgi:glycosyltransferase involved in cell wall biosynthesis